jgi:hypothetical protein
MFGASMAVHLILYQEGERSPKYFITSAQAKLLATHLGVKRYTLHQALAAMCKNDMCKSWLVPTKMLQVLQQVGTMLLSNMSVMLLNVKRRLYNMW